MPSTQEFRRRIKSVNNTKQITKAMQMVASVKMQKAVKTILEAREYVQESWHMLVKLASLTLPENHPLLNPRPTNKTAIIFITSDRGLCGSYVTDLGKKLISYCSSLGENSSGNSSRPSSSNNNPVELQTPSPLLPTNIDIITIGKKGAEFVKSRGIGNLVASFDGFENDVNIEDIVPISLMTNGEYLNGKYDKVVVVYSHFVSSLRQTPVVKQILPIDKDHIDLPELWQQNDEYTKDVEFKFEPDADKILDKLLRRMIRIQLYGAVLEGNASEQSARMLAMKNATDNAEELIAELTLTYNSIRQNSITNEIAEISAAAESMR